MTSENDRGCQTDYTLKGVRGYFNSVWFDEVFSDTSLAVSHTVPIVGKSCECYKLELEDRKWHLKPCNTSAVREVQQIGENVYYVTTCNSVYVIQVK